jgi:hypothetical protein
LAEEVRNGLSSPTSLSPMRRRRSLGKIKHPRHSTGENSPPRTSVSRWGMVKQEEVLMNSDSLVALTSHCTRLGQRPSISSAPVASKPPSAPCGVHTEKHARDRRVSCDHLSGSDSASAVIFSDISRRLGICNAFIVSSDPSPFALCTRILRSIGRSSGPSSITGCSEVVSPKQF